MKKHFLIALFLLVTSMQAQWVEEKGKGYFKIGSWWLEANEHYTNTGEIDPNATRGLLINSLYARYGISSKMTIVGYFPYTQVYQNRQVFSSGRTPVAGEEYSSLGDINLALEYQWFDVKGWAISSSLTLGIPSGNNRGGSDGSYQTGDGEFNQLVQFKIGNSFRLGEKYFYTKTNFGFNQRTNGFSDEFHAGLETGTQIFKEKVLLLGRLNIQESLNNGSLDASNSNGSIFANNVEVVNLGAELIYTFYKKWSLGLSSSFPIAGKLIYRAPAFAFGFSLQL